MYGKYRNIIEYFTRYIYREIYRSILANVISYNSTSENLENSLTIIIAAAARLPHILEANLLYLQKALWEDVKEILIIFDSEKNSLTNDFELYVKSKFPQMRLRFLYYNKMQKMIADWLCLPCIYAWLSWCIGIKNCTTRHILLHDYDAFVLSKDILEKRYKIFVQSKTKIQGIRWYSSNGIMPEDKLATTFEALLDANWVRSFKPILLFNKIGLIGNRAVNFDILLHLQSTRTAYNERSIEPMSFDELVHPSQIIHQYTMFVKFPGKIQQCSSIPILPLIYFLDSKLDAIQNAITALTLSDKSSVDFLGDGIKINFSLLTTTCVDWALKQMIQLLIHADIRPFKDFYEYGITLYSISSTEKNRYWLGDFTPLQRQWINAAQQC